MTLAADEFIRRFLLHVLPDGFQRIRYYGFLANRYREQTLARCRQLLAMPQPEPPDNHAAGDYRDQATAGPYCRTDQQRCAHSPCPATSTEPARCTFHYRCLRLKACTPGRSTIPAHYRRCHSIPIARGAVPRFSPIRF